MKNVRFFLSENFPSLVVKFSVYLNVFVVNSELIRKKVSPFRKFSCSETLYVFIHIGSIKIVRLPRMSALGPCAQHMLVHSDSFGLIRSIPFH